MVCTKGYSLNVKKKQLRPDFLRPWHRLPKMLISSLLHHYKHINVDFHLKTYSTQNLAQIIPHRGDHWVVLQDALSSDIRESKQAIKFDISNYTSLIKHYMPHVLLCTCH